MGAHPPIKSGIAMQSYGFGATVVNGRMTSSVTELADYIGGKATAPAAVVSGGGSGDQHGGEWAGPVAAGTGPAAGGDMRAHSPGKDLAHHNHSPAHSNRNSVASSDSGRGFSTGHLEPKVVTVIGQHRLSDQSYESGVSSRQSYHSTSSSSLGSLDRLEESGHASTINVQQLIQAGVPDKEVLHAWLHDLHFEDYYSNFVQASYDMPTISRMTPEDLTAIGITKPAHRKRLKAEIARLHIHDGIPDFCPHDLIEWLHLLGLGMYHETLAGQGYDDIEYVTDITWEDLEEIGIKKLGHQKKIMLAIDRLKRITSASKRLSSIEPRRSSIEMLEPPPPAPPIGRWSGEISALPPHMYEGGLGVGAKPKKSPSGDSISTTGSGGSNSSQGSGEMRAIPLPREDAGIAGGIPYNRQTSATSASSGGHSDVVAIQVKRQGRSSTSEDSSKEVEGPQALYQSFQGPVGSKGGSGDFPTAHPMSTSDPGMAIQGPPQVQPKPIAKIAAKPKCTSRDYSPDAEMEKHESENNSDGHKTAPAMSSAVSAMAAMLERSGEVYTGGTLKRGASSSPGGGGQLRVEIREHIYDQPQMSPSASNAPPSPKPQVMPKPASPLHVTTHHNPSAPSSGSPTGRSKKAPPPPPKRTHSIRNDAAPPVVNKAEVTNALSVTTTTSIGLGSPPATSSVKKTSANTPANTSVTATTAVAAAKPEPAVAEKPQTQAFASCVKSLSERFGSKKSEIEGSQESLSSDSDDFPPPPPPIAMDIITPKIHNYGIPSKSDIHHTPTHVRDFSMHSHHSHPVPPQDYSAGFQNRLKTLQASEGGSARSEQHSLMPTAVPLKRISPGRDIPATIMPHERAKDVEAPPMSSSLGDKRSESTTSFESTTSSSSTDSNTLPFANENVGTIKQRAAVIKPSIVQTLDTGDGQRTVDLNMALFDSAMGDNMAVNMSRTNASGANLEGAGAQTGAAGYHRTESGSSGSGVVNSRSVAPGVPNGAHVQTVASATSRLTATVPSASRLSQHNHGAPSEGPSRPPVPSKKPTLVPASPQQQARQISQQHPQHRLPQQQRPASQTQQQHQPLQQRPASQTQQQHQPLQQRTASQTPPQQQQPQSQAVQHQEKQRPTPQASSHQQHQKPTAEHKPAAPSLPLGTTEEAPQRQSCDVLSDIDNMLQGLTDELDAMLLEETVG